MKKGLALLLALTLVFTAGTALAGKDHIKLAMSDVPVGVDFYATTSRAALYYAYQIFDPLLERDPKTGKLTPHLVTSWKTIDNNTWEFKLKPGVKFHNGEPFNAESVRFTIQDIIQNPEFKSPQAGGLEMVLQDRGHRRPNLPDHHRKSPIRWWSNGSTFFSLRTPNGSRK